MGCRGWSTCSRPGKYLMEDFYYAGGLPAVMREILPLLKTDAITVTGKTMGENVANAERTDWSGQEGSPRTPSSALSATRSAAAREPQY